jgi:uncharacterized membrane protein
MVASLMRVGHLTIRCKSEYLGENLKRSIMFQSHIQEHVDLIAKHEQEFLARRTQTEKLGDSIASFVGSLLFVSLHLLAFASWMTWNVMPHLRHFDPPPFSLLGALVAIEALLLASFILMRQARMGRRADERDHLMLQVLLLTEREITAVIKMDRQIAKEMGLNRVADNTEVQELSQQTSIEHVAQTIKDNLPSAE